MKQYLNKDQCKTLIELDININTLSSLNLGTRSNGDFIPTLTIGELLEKIPIMVKDSYGFEYERILASNAVLFLCPDNILGFSFLKQFRKEELIDNLFDALVWCIESKKL